MSFMCDQPAFAADVEAVRAGAGRAVGLRHGRQCGERAQGKAQKSGAGEFHLNLLTNRGNFADDPQEINIG